MRDFPIFSTQNGIASITLNQIPYTGNAYIKLQDTLAPAQLLEECVDFCKAAGADRIYGTGHTILSKYPLHTIIIRMSRALDGMLETDAALFPVTEKTIAQWAELYNDKMRNIPNAVYLSTKAAQEILHRGNGYFVHKDGTLLGIGIASADTIEAVIAAWPGMGEQVLCALCHALSGDMIHLDVAQNNERAVRLYERLGFIKTSEISRWYKIFEV